MRIERTENMRTLEVVEASAPGEEDIRIASWRSTETLMTIN